MRLLLMRHGDNNSLHQGILPGRIPGVHLNENGRAEVERMAELFREVPLAAVYASPLERTMETAEIMIRGRNLSVNPEDAFLENDLKEWEGKSFKELVQLQEWKAFCEDPYTAPNDWAETPQKLQERAVDAVERLLAAHEEDAAVMVVSHGDVIRAVLCHYLDMRLTSLRKLTINTASISVISFNRETSRVDCVNATAGLDWLIARRSD